MTALKFKAVFKDSVAVWPLGIHPIIAGEPDSSLVKLPTPPQGKRSLINMDASGQ
jgi:hypothetical protein